VLTVFLGSLAGEDGMKFLVVGVADPSHVIDY
jgi:hypothetical protein